ncbi:MAG: hypothetical protein Kow0029_18490 [Candidatus Rifleibacteriota bacterium]
MEEKNSQRLDTLARELEKRKRQHSEGTSRSRTIRKLVRRMVMLFALVAFVLAGIFIFNFLRLNSDLVEGHIKQGIIPNLTQGMFDLEIGSISGNLINGVQLENILVQNPHFKVNKTLMTIPRISMKYSLWGIFWGHVTLEKLHIENPVLTLIRNDDGRGNWDFSQESKAEVKKSGKQTKWQEREQNQALADNYLTDISVSSLSILIPNPKELIRDEFLGKIIKLPARTYQISDINLTLKKYPAEKFVSHIFSVAIPGDPNFLRFQFTRTKSNGNFTLSFDAIGQNFNFAVENLGLDGRKINFYDGRMKERLNLEWIWARKPVNLLEKIRGFNGVLRIPDFNYIFGNLLASGSRLAGSLELEASCPSYKCLYDAELRLKLNKCEASIPLLAKVDEFSAEVVSSNRVAHILNLNVKLGDIISSHTGMIDFSDEANINGNLHSSIMGDDVNVKASYIREDTGLHKLDVNLQRKSGMAKIEFKRQLAGKAIVYRDFKIEAGLVKNGKAVEILPLNVLPSEVANSIMKWFQRIDLVGPLMAKTKFVTIEKWKDSELELSFSKSRIVNRTNPDDFIELDGEARLASGVLRIDSLRAGIDKLFLDCSGYFETIATSPFINNYSIELNGHMKGNEICEITSERLQKSLGLTVRPDFDRVQIRGQKILEAKLSSDASLNKVELNLDQIRFFRRKKPLWLDDFKLKLETGAFNAFAGKLPGPVDLSLDGAFFGIPVKSELKANVASRTIEELSVKGGGSNFGKIVEAIISQPEGAAFFRKYPMNISGAFNFAFLGKGLLETPQLEGWLRFPALSFSSRQAYARLPFYVMVKTEDKDYVAEFNAGDASLQVAGVKFDLGKTSGKARFIQPFVVKDPEISFTADSEVFSTNLKAIGKVKPASKKISSLKLKLNSKKIEVLAGEIARIGKFRIPFDIAGKFSAEASLWGNFASPSARGDVSLSNLSLDFPVETGNKKTVLKATNFSGSAAFEKKSNDEFNLAVKELNGSILGAAVTVEGVAALKREKAGLKPQVNGLRATFKNLKASDLGNYLGLLNNDLLNKLSFETGMLAGDFALSGNPDKVMARGSAQFSNVGIRYPALAEKISDLNGSLMFEGRTDDGYAKIGVENLSARFGRSKFSVSKGYVEDPIRSGQINLAGKAEKVFPNDLINMLGGLKIGSISFPEEGWLDGSFNLSGTIWNPAISARINSSKMVVAYDSGTTVYTVPVGNNLLDFNYHLQSGKINLKEGMLSLLDGQIKVEKASGRFAAGMPFLFNLSGSIEHLDLGKFKMSDAESIKGKIAGNYKAEWTEGGAKEAVFNLKINDLFIPRIPVVDPATVAKIGIDFIEKPDFRVGELNFYVTSDEEKDYAGKLLIADGLFAGPHLRLELGNSEFDPYAMKLNGRLMLNPQSLRKTDIGRKLKKLSATIQDKKTGIPYIDLNLSGTWDKPELMAKQIERKAKKRAKKNFIRKLFGGSGPHKASVEELMNWFPGWKKGM